MTMMTRRQPVQTRGLRRVSTAQAKATLSELIGAVAFGHERVVIERRGRPVAVLLSVGEAEQLEDALPAPRRRRGALALVGIWSGVEDEMVDRIVSDIYAARERDLGRPVDLS
ncbi:MAG: hypothetical protein C0498_09150 [Anaerolinea sp.]|nr:hypothetical protein [Anaerolinea sp.]